jgi:GrpB-like predicted nucleotidyltransferase (UPF0157 family)
MPEHVIAVENYGHMPLVCKEWDPRAPSVAAALANAILDREPRLSVEHVGSSSVPGCAGKGVIDLMVVYEAGDLEPAKRALDDLGFQPQTGNDVFPEDRPMRVGLVRHDGSAFNVHAHVIAQGSSEMEELKGFRDKLRSDPDLVARYAAHKRAIISGGVTEKDKYTVAKGAFVEKVMGWQTTWRGVVERIYIGTEATGPMTERWQVRALEGKGLEGDRYAEGRGTFSNKPATGRHVTLIEAEALEAVAKTKQIGLDVTRRNIVTRGVPLNHLVDTDFTVGEVVLRGMRLCEPCNHLCQLAGDDELKPAFLHRGGLRAEIVTGGTIHVKDVVAAVET